jgi:hypothetical protein
VRLSAVTRSAKRRRHNHVQNMQRDEPRKLIFLIRRFDNLDKVLMILLHLFCTVP